MLFLNSNRALLQGVMAGAMVLASATACSRSDRSESGQDNTAAVLSDTTTSTGTISDTASDTGAQSGALSDTASVPAPSSAPRAATATPSAEGQDTSISSDTAAAGYRAMERDTAAAPVEPSDSASVTEDTSVSSVEVSDTMDTSWTEMARDTSTTADQIDTTGAAVSGDVALETRMDTTHADTAEDSTEVLGEVTTNTTAEVASADTTMESDRIRPPEDSTEWYGDAISDETADEQVIDAEDREAVAASEGRTAEVGAAAVGGDVTGAEAVSLMTRQGARCIMVDPETNEEVRWDMSSTPVTLNPCGLGSMNLSKIRTER